MIDPIQQIQAITPLRQTAPTSQTESSGRLFESVFQSALQNAKDADALTELDDSLFGSIFQSAIQNVKDTDADWTQSEYLLSTGQLDNPATALISFTKLSTATNLLIQLRNKALDAYSELTRLSM